MSDRGMKKWAPYKALTEQYEDLDVMTDEMKRQEMPILSLDQEEEINDVLVHYNEQDLKVTYWRKGKIYIIVSKIKFIDVVNKKITLQDDERILFSELINLQIL